MEEWIFFFWGSFSYHSTLNLVLLYVVDRISLRVTMRDASLDLEADPTPPTNSNFLWREMSLFHANLIIPVLNEDRP